VTQDREEGPDLRDRHDLDALCWHGVYRHARRTVAMVEQYLGKQAARRVSQDDRGALQLVDDALVMLDDGRDGQRLDRGGVLVQRLDLLPPATLPLRRARRSSASPPISRSSASTSGRMRMVDLTPHYEPMS
jgi:hypothetical protein